MAIGVMLSRVANNIARSIPRRQGRADAESVQEKANGSRVGEAEGVAAPAGAWAVILGMVILAQVLVIFIQLLKM